MKTKVTNSGQIVHVGGRKRPIATAESHPHLFRRASRYLKGLLPTPPSEYDGFSASLAAQADILGNDQLGDCTAAGACHLVEAWTAKAGSPVVLKREDAVGFYSIATGYDPNDASTDQGGDEVQVCTTWRDKGFDGNGSHAIAGWLVVDATNEAEVAALCWMFGLYFGMELDAHWSSLVTGDGYTWDSGTPDPSEGHCVVGKRWSASRRAIGINSWGFLGWLTTRAIAKFCVDSAGGNVFAILSKETVTAAQQKSPEGFDWQTLLADFNGLGGNASV